MVVTKLADHGDVLAASGGLTYEDAAVMSVADYAGGSVREGLAILESIIAYGPVTMDSVVAVMGKVTPVHLDEFVAAVVKGDLKKADTILHELYNDKFMDGFLKYLFGSYFPRGRTVTDAQRRVVTAMLKAATTFVPTYSYSVNRDLLLYSIVESIDAVKHAPQARTAPVPAPTPVTPQAPANAPTPAPKPATPQTNAPALPQGKDESVLQLIQRFEAQVIRPWDGEVAVMSVGTKGVLVAIAGSPASVPTNVGYIIPLGRVPVILKRPTLVVRDMISENLIVRLNRS
jgi:DNA polymerase III gamma/tau subunit